MKNTHNSNNRKLRFFSLSRLHYDAQGRIRTVTPPMANEAWEPYFEFFSEIVIYARVERNRIEDRGFYLDDPRITIVELPYYDGVRDFFRKAYKIRRFILSQITNANDYYGMWLPSQIAPSVVRGVTRIGAPFLVIVIGDPADVAESIIPKPFRRIASTLIVRATRRAVLSATGVVYVTLEALQRKYPARPEVETLSRSNVRFSEGMLNTRVKCYEDFSEKGDVSLIAVGSQQQNYKGHDLLIDAVARLQEEGFAVQLTLVGQGTLHDDLVAQSTRLGLRNVTFHAHVGDSLGVAREISKHDIFLMPSRTEGMPKSLLEAMVVGVFSLGSRVGGIPEVLERDCTFEPDSVDAIVERIRHFLVNRESIINHVANQRKMVENIRENHSGDPIMINFLRKWVVESL